MNLFLLLSRMSKRTRNKVSYNFDEAVDYLLESDEEDLGSGMPSEWNLLYRKRDQNVKETLVL